MTAPVIYDVTTDSFRPVTQAEVNAMIARLNARATSVQFPWGLSTAPVAHGPGIAIPPNMSSVSPMTKGETPAWLLGMCGNMGAAHPDVWSADATMAAR